MVHTRDTTTDGDLFDPAEPGQFIVDCSCGETYLVSKPTDQRDEFTALESAQHSHAGSC